MRKILKKIPKFGDYNKMQEAKINGGKSMQIFLFH